MVVGKSFVTVGSYGLYPAHVEVSLFDQFKISIIQGYDFKNQIRVSFLVFFQYLDIARLTLILLVLPSLRLLHLMSKLRLRKIQLLSEHIPPILQLLNPQKQPILLLRIIFLIFLRFFHLQPRTLQLLLQPDNPILNLIIYSMSTGHLLLQLGVVMHNGHHLV